MNDGDTPHDGHRLDPVFSPDSIAIVGASTNPRSPGFRYVKTNVDRGFDPVYPVNPNAESVYGCRAYDSLHDIPEPVDLAIVLLRAETVPAILNECIEIGIPAVHIGSSGFSETGTPEGSALAAEIRSIIESGDLTVVGPNCMGIHSPRANLSYLSIAPETLGRVAYVSHSGGFTLDLLNAGQAFGIDFSYGASIGNEIDVTLADCLAYFLDDQETDVIGMYVEGVPDRSAGDRLFALLNDATKPVVAIKGGRTDRGGDAARSHTAALAGSDRVWRAIFRQTDTIVVNSLAEMRDVFVLLAHGRPVTSSELALVGPGGGTTVMTLDACTRAGLSVPPFEASTIEALEAVDVPAAGNLTNPVDVPFSALFLDGGETFRSLIGTVCDDPNVGTVLVHVNATHFTYATIDGESAFRKMVSAVTDVANSVALPMCLVFRNFDAVPRLYEQSLELRRDCYAVDVPVFDSMTAAVSAIESVVGVAAAGSVSDRSPDEQSSGGMK